MTQTQDRAPTLLSDYAPPAFLIDEADLTFDLDRAVTRVRSRLALRRNPEAPVSGDLVLDGCGLETAAASVEGDPAASGRLLAEGDRLTVRDAPDRLVVATEVLIRPQDNRALRGLYVSGPLLCTQCEPEDFRRITWYLDRPDVLARFRVRLVGDPGQFPALLSNGNRTGEGALPDGRRWAEWTDPFPKPGYLFALVAGPLDCLADRFTTASGREVALRIYADSKNIPRCHHAMQSLKHSMRWDENAYGLEYDLDCFMIVVIDDFNMGAMENKGLNLFNSSLVLARPDTATDADHAAIESVIAHEYFHNWTGNRVTCRDWFQLSLKEGLTVFRDRQFTEDRSEPEVARIHQVRQLRSVQFPEDAGPMAHPVRPDSYIEINNFYTSTVYEKGAEVIRMLHSLLGNEAYRAGIREYFKRHDGKAATVEDFMAAMEAASGRDLSRFRHWYSQAGTPVVTVKESYDAARREFTLTLSQRTPPTPGQPRKEPLHMPLRTALLGRDGKHLPLHCAEPALQGEQEAVLELREAAESFVFRGVDEPPTASVGRNFSAPVILDAACDDDRLLFLAAHETDLFNRWDAVQTLASRILLEEVRRRAGGGAADPNWGPPDPFVTAFRSLLCSPTLAPAFIAEAITLPSESNLADRMDRLEVEAVHDVRRAFLGKLGRRLAADFRQIRNSLLDSGPYVFSHAQAGRRALANACLSHFSRSGHPDAADLCARQLRNAGNMTDSLAALRCLADHDGPEREEALEWFHDRWAGEPLALDKWFAVQATSRLPDTLARVKALRNHAAFDIGNPNRTRSLIGAFCLRNQRRFHDASGDGYRFLADCVLEIDGFNPQIAARLLTAASQWRKLDDSRREALRGELSRILAAPGLSRESYEIALKTLDRSPMS